jgi:hypothetical protein
LLRADRWGSVPLHRTVSGWRVTIRPAGWPGFTLTCVADAVPLSIAYDNSGQTFK